MREEPHGREGFAPAEDFLATVSMEAIPLATKIDRLSLETERPVPAAEPSAGQQEIGHSRGMNEVILSGQEGSLT